MSLPQRPRDVRAHPTPNRVAAGRATEGPNIDQINWRDEPILRVDVLVIVSQVGGNHAIEVSRGHGVPERGRR